MIRQSSLYLVPKTLLLLFWVHFFQLLRLGPDKLLSYLTRICQCSNKLMTQRNRAIIIWGAWDSSQMMTVNINYNGCRNTLTQHHITLDNISTVLLALHRLPLTKRIDYTALMKTYTILNDLVTTYLGSLTTILTRKALRTSSRFGKAHNQNKKYSNHIFNWAAGRLCNKNVDEDLKRTLFMRVFSFGFWYNFILRYSLIYILL